LTGGNNEKAIVTFNHDIILFQILWL